MTKKTKLLSIGSLFSVVAPVAAVVSCGTSGSGNNAYEAPATGAGSSFAPSGMTVTADPIPQKYIQSVKDLYGYDLWLSAKAQSAPWDTPYKGVSDNVLSSEMSSLALNESAYSANVDHFIYRHLSQYGSYSDSLIHTLSTHISIDSNNIKYLVTRVGGSAFRTGHYGEKKYEGMNFISDKERMTILDKNGNKILVTNSTPHIYSSLANYSFFSKRYFTEKLGAIGHKIQPAGDVVNDVNFALDTIYGEPQITHARWRREDEELYIRNDGYVVIPVSVLEDRERTEQWHYMAQINPEQ